MKTSIWGPSAWRFLHAITFAYPEQPTEEHKAAARQLFHSLKLLLPCGDCCSHYCQSLDESRVEPHLKSRETLSKWLHAFHNAVNERLGKPAYSYEQAVADYNPDDEFCALQSSCGDSVKQEQAKPFNPIVFLAISATMLLLFLAFRLGRASKMAFGAH